MFSSVRDALLLEAAATLLPEVDGLGVLGLGEGNSVETLCAPATVPPCRTFAEMSAYHIACVTRTITPAIINNMIERIYLSLITLQDSPTSTNPAIVITTPTISRSPRLNNP